MDLILKNKINDLRVAIYAYNKGLYAASMRSIMIYAKKLISITNIKELMNEYNDSTSEMYNKEKIDIEQALYYINQAKEKDNTKNINRNSHPILEKFDNVLENHSNHLKSECEKYFNGLRNEFLKVQPIKIYEYANNEAIKMLPEELKNIDDEMRYRNNEELKLQSKKQIFISEYVRENQIYKLISSLTFDYKNEIKWIEWLNKKVEEIIKANKFKLYSTVIKKLKSLDIEKIEENYIRTGVQGFEGNFTLTLKNKTEKIFKVHSIYAGGYNIQCEHYRFLTNLK